VINLLTGEPILPAKTANDDRSFIVLTETKFSFPISGQILVRLARYWFAVYAGKIGSQVMRFIIPKP
jgi:hypothetical protein